MGKGWSTIRAPINERQRDLLLRIAKGEEFTHLNSRSTTLYPSLKALGDRGLITSPGTGRYEKEWTSRITEAGRFFLDFGHFPDDEDFTAPGVENPRKTRRPPLAQRDWQPTVRTADALPSVNIPLRLAVTLKQAANMVGVSEQILVKAIHTTEPKASIPALRGKRVGTTKYLILIKDLVDWLDRLPDA